MSMNEFLKNKSPTIKCSCGKILSKNMVMIEIEDLGMFFWNRYGVDFVHARHQLNNIDDTGCNIIGKTISSVSKIHKDAKSLINDVNLEQEENGSYIALMAQDFLDAYDCLEKDKIKELIEEL